MKILVIGSSGQLGTQIFNLKNSLSLADFSFCNKRELDVSSAESVESFSSNELLKFSNSLGFSSDESKNLVEAFKISKTKKLNICVCGSLYLAGEFLRLNETTPS